MIVLELLKELLGDPSVKVDKMRIKYVQEYVRDEIEKETIIQTHGRRAYYIGKLKAFWQFWNHYGYAVYIAIMLLVLAVLVFQLSAGLLVNWIAGFDWIPGISFLLTALEVIFLIFYVFCKNHRKKWTSAAAIIGLVMLKQLWNLINTGAISGSVDTLLFLMLFLAVHHYEQWKREFAKKSAELQQWLQDGDFPDDEIIGLYHRLEALRFTGGRKAGKMQQDEEIDEMLLYLNFRKQDNQAAEILEQLRTDAISETYEGLELPEPAESEPAEPAGKEPLTRQNAKDRLAMPVFFALCFPGFYLALAWFFTAAKQDADMGGMVICAAVIVVLLVLVVAVFGHEEKNPRRKFYLELVPALALELMLAMDVYFLLSGHYAERGARGLKSFLLFLCVGIPWFFSYVNKTQKNWKQMQTEKNEVEK